MNSLQTSIHRWLLISLVILIVVALPACKSDTSSSQPLPATTVSNGEEVIMTTTPEAATPTPQPSEPVRIESRPGTPYLTDEIIYFGTENGIFYAMDRVTGEEKWRLPTGAANLNRPVVVNGIVYTGGQDGVLYAVDAATGTVHWQFAAGQVDWSIRDRFINGTPTVLDGTVYFSSEDFNVYAVDATTGMERWRFTLDEEPQAFELPIVDGIAYIGTWGGSLYAIDVATGTEVWRAQISNGRSAANGDGAAGSHVSYVTAVPLIMDDMVYVTDWSGQLTAVNRQDGQIIWQFQPQTIAARHVGSRTSFVAHDDVLYYATIEDKHLYGVDRHTGEKVWEFGADGWLYGPFPGMNDVALVIEFPLSDSGVPEGMVLHGFSLSTREFLWTNENIASLPWVDEGVVYLGGMDGTLYGLDLLGGDVVWQLGR